MAQVSKFKPQSDKGTDVRTERVAEIARQIKNGTYFDVEEVDRVASGLAELFMEDYFDNI
ncbi:MAG: flagellar biosynthesis anti-sigma factor FlgM [Fibrobacterales bacterium]